MEFTDVVTERRTVRSYADDPIDRDTIAAIIEEATLAPSSFNLQPWEFLVVSDEENRERLQDIACGQPQVTDAPVVVAVFGSLDPAANADRVLADEVEKGYRDEAAAERTREAIEGKREGSEADRRLWTTASTSLAAMTLMLAARARGLGTCPMGGFDADRLVEEFDVPDEYEPVMLVTMGYPAEDSDAETLPRKFRRPVEEVAHFETFDADGDASEAGDGRATGEPAAAANTTIANDD